MFRRKEEADSEGALFETAQGYANSPTTAQATVTVPGQHNAQSHASQQPQQQHNLVQPLREPAKPQQASAPVYRPANNDAPRAAARAIEPGKASLPASLTQAASRNANRRLLTVGPEIQLKGEISDCDRLLIEGRVDATVNNVHTLEIAEVGSFKGSADVEEAEISGLFEGNLNVRGRLVIYSSGKVRGKITYGEIEIERGGEVSGEIKTFASAGALPSGKKSQAA